MQKRKYTHLKAVEEVILSMRQDGLTLREIADELGLSLKQMKNWSYRHNCDMPLISIADLPLANQILFH